MITVLSPHPDDAVLSCWSVLSREHDVAVINVFAAAPEPGSPLMQWDRITGARDPHERMLERAREDAAALRLVGIRPTNLNFLQQSYRREEQDVGPLVSQIVMRTERPGPVYAPAGIGGHPDHLTVRAVAVALLKKGYSVNLYGELPYCVRFGWPHWVAGREADPYLDLTHDWQWYLDNGDVSVRAESAVVEALTPVEQAGKLDATKCYRSQFNGLLRLLPHDDSLHYEVFWPLEPVALGRLESLGHEFLWRLGARRGSRLERLFRHRALRRLKPRPGTRLGRLVRPRGT